MYLFYDSDVKFAHRDLVVNGHFVNSSLRSEFSIKKKTKVGKVNIFWEGCKILRNLQVKFD